MKHLITLVIPLMTLNIVFAQNWKHVHPLPHGYLMFDMDFSDQMHGWKVGNNGVMSKTVDGGVTWNKVLFQEPVFLRSVAFVTKDKGYVLTGDNELYQTTDGALTWTNISIPVLAPFTRYLDIYFFDELNGWITTQNLDYILKTSDGGQTWQQQIINNNVILCSDIQFISPNEGWLLIAGSLHHTTDGGTTWAEIGYPQFAGLGDIEVLDHQRIWAAGSNNAVYYSDDGGWTWTFKGPALASFFPDYEQIMFFDDQYGMLLNYHQTTSDGGQTWQFVTPTTGLKYVEKINKTTAVSLYGGRTTDFSQTWTHHLHSFSNTYLNSSIKTDFSSPTDGWLASYFPLGLFRTTDMGCSWEEIIAIDDSTFSSGYIRNIMAISNDELIMLHDDGMFKTFDGGQNWMNVTVDTSGGFAPLTTISKYSSINDTVFYALTPNNCLKSTDSGLNWNFIDLSNFPINAGAFRDFYFLNENEGFIVGYNKVAKTLDGGQTWTEITPNSHSFLKVFFLDNQTGWITDIGTGVWKTTNGGTSWVLELSSTVSAPTIRFTDSQNGFLLTGSHENKKTTDGGQTWQDWDVYIPFSILDMEFFSTSEGVITGINDIMVLSSQSEPHQYSIEGALCNGFFTYGGVQYDSSGIYTLYQNCDTIIKLNVVDQLYPPIVKDGQDLRTRPYAAYQWYLDGQPISGANTPIYTPSASGFYQVEVTDINGCTGFSDSLLFIMVNTQEVLNEPVEVYLFPNPTTNVFQYETNETIDFIEIMDMKGQILNRLQVRSSVINEVSLNNLPSGSYIVKFVSDNQSVVKKIILQKE